MDFKKWCDIDCTQILLLLCTFKVVLSDRQCSQGLATPGYTIPHGDIIIEDGETLNITCILVDDTGKNASLSFARNNVNLPSELIKVINSTAIQLVSKNPNKTSGDTYICKQGETIVCMNHVIIGTKPQPPKDFSCIGYNFENITCTFTAPENYIPTVYKLFFTLENRTRKYPIYCSQKSITSNKITCEMNMYTTRPYQRAHKFYNFTLMMSNRLEDNSLTINNFNHFAHVLPASPENLTVLSTTTSSVELYWNVPTEMQSFPPGLHHRILYQCKGRDKTWHLGGLITESRNNKDATFNLTNLEHAYTLCVIRVSLRSAEASPGDELMWSKNASIRVRTNSKIPDAPPETNVGSFEIVTINDSVQISEAYIYWKQIPEVQKNGPDFKYKISVEGDTSKVPIEITNVYAKFEDLLNDKDYTFHIWSENANGTSIRMSTVYVPRQLDRIKEPQSFNKVEYKDGKYELTWQPPKMSNQVITNYTIFFCENDRVWPYQCNNTLDWTIVPSTATSKVIRMEKQKNFEFAISANTKTSSSGMLWAACTIIHSKNIGKMKTVWIHESESTFIDVRWKLDCSDRIGNILGFIVYYCPVESPSHTECNDTAGQNVTFKGSNIEGGNVTNLKPYTTYMLTVSVITNNTYGPKSDPLYDTTREAAPSPPQHLRVVNVTNSSISLAWDKPEAMNGVLRHYKITYWEENNSKITNTTKDLNITIHNLVSFKKYTIKVSVCTIECSEEKTIHQSTQRGYPSKIKKPTVDRRNDTSITIVWDAPSEPGDVTDHYTVRLKQRHKNENKTIERNTKNRVSVINCGDGDKFNTFYISVKAVNIIEDKEYNGTWSDEMENYCNVPVNFRLYILLFCAACAMVFAGFMAVRLYHRFKKMSHVEVVLPPGLELLVTDHNRVPWSTEKYQESRASYSPPDEISLVKMSEGAHYSDVTLEPESHKTRNSESENEQPRNNCAKIDLSYIPVATPDLDKSLYKTCDVSNESSPYVMTGEQSPETINSEYIPFNQAEPVRESTGYVVAGINNGYPPFNQIDTVNRNTGYVVAGIENGK